MFVALRCVGVWRSGFFKEGLYITVSPYNYNGNFFFIEQVILVKFYMLNRFAVRKMHQKKIFFCISDATMTCSLLLMEQGRG